MRRLVDDKAQLAGVGVILVDATKGGRTRLECGPVGERNRQGHALFRCVWCDEGAKADFNAARLIGTRTLVNAP